MGSSRIQRSAACVAARYATSRSNATSRSSREVGDDEDERGTLPMAFISGVSIALCSRRICSLPVGVRTSVDARLEQPPPPAALSGSPAPGDEVAVASDSFSLLSAILRSPGESTGSCGSLIFLVRWRRSVALRCSRSDKRWLGLSTVLLRSRGNDFYSIELLLRLEKWGTPLLVLRVRRRAGDTPCSARVASYATAYYGVYRRGE
eukprot:6566605-Prymnesium_polylepis.1